MTDQPGSRPDPRPEDASDPLEPTRPLDIPRYAPAPDPRPDTRWAWATGDPDPGTGRERWTEPVPSAASGSGPGSPWSGPVVGRSGPDTWPRYEGAPPALPPVAPVSPKRERRGSVIGPVLAASLLSAVLASGGTVAVLDQAGAFDRPAVAQPTAGATSAGTTQPIRIDESSAVIDAAARVSPAVVRITTESTQNVDVFGQVPSTGVGSGVIYDASGWIVTNRHVVADSNSLTVELKDGRQFAGRVYGIDTLTDLAIVKIDASNLTAAPIGESDGLKIGQLVVAIGSPLGTYSFSVTSGIVSGTGRSITVEGGTRISNLIQTDAAINPGNSGGPLVDATGAVVGINTAVATNSNGIGFAIPIDIARPIMGQAVRGETLARPWIGIRFQPINRQLQDEQKLPVDAGALIDSGTAGDPAVVPDSPAAKADLREGDIIVSLDGIKIDQEHPLDALLVQFAPGTTITLEVLRDGATISVPVTLGTRPADL
jgi:S1-C subfamily serine protease